MRGYLFVLVELDSLWCSVFVLVPVDPLLGSELVPLIPLLLPLMPLLLPLIPELPELPLMPELPLIPLLPLMSLLLPVPPDVDPVVADDSWWAVFELFAFFAFLACFFVVFVVVVVSLLPLEPPPGLVAPEVLDVPALPLWANAGALASAKRDATRTLSLRMFVLSLVRVVSRSSWR